MASNDNIQLSAINKPESLGQEVYERIKEAIISNNFYPGQKLDETRLSEMLGVSRTPVREALSRLTHEGLVSSVHNRGMTVAIVTTENLLEILNIREVLEGLAVRLFCQSASDDEIESTAGIIERFNKETVDDEIDEYNLANVEFHNAITNGCKNSKLMNLLETLYDHFSMAKKLKLISITKRAKRSLKQHKEIIAALRERDAYKAELLMRKHIDSLREDVMRNQ